MFLRTIAAKKERLRHFLPMIKEKVEWMDATTLSITTYSITTLRMKMLIMIIIATLRIKFT